MIGRTRVISIPVFLGIVAVYLAVIQVGGRIASSTLDEAEFGEYKTTDEVVVGLLIPVGISLLFVYGVVAVLGWWRPVFVDDRSVQRWLWVIPTVFAASVLLGLNYPDLVDKDVGFRARAPPGDSVRRLRRGRHVPRHRRHRLPRERFQRGKGGALDVRRVRPRPPDELLRRTRAAGRSLRRSSSRSPATSST